MYFVVFITIGAFVFANLIIAVVVTNLERAYDQLKKSHKARYRRLKGQADVSAPVNRPLADIKEVPEDVWEKQVPYEVPDLTKVSQEKFEQYCLVLTLIEENAKTYKSLKNQLKPIVAEVKELNINNEKDEDESPMGSDGDLDDEDLDDMSGGDPLSRMLRR